VDFSRDYNSYDSWDSDNGWEIGWSGTGTLIVGFEIDNNWPEDEGGYVNVAPPSSVLLTDTMSLYVWPDSSRGCHWTLSVYTVSAADYDFAQAITAHAK
jgi:hypothetical protein